MFSLARSEAQCDADELGDKLERIREIRRRGFEVGHAIHRHGMTEDQALEVARSSVYEQVRYAWKLDPARAAKADLVLAVERGLIVGAFIAEQWLAATPENFPGTIEKREGRWGFVGRAADPDVAQLYLRKRLPANLRRPGAANPVRYVSSAGGAVASQATCLRGHRQWLVEREIRSVRGSCEGGEGPLHQAWHRR